MAKAKKQDEVIEETAVVEETPVVEAVTEKTAVAETDETTEVVETKEEKALAKAGKRSAKAAKEAEEKEAKEERKAGAAEAEEKPKQHANPTRSRLERRGKNFRKAAELIETDKMYTLVEALELATKTNPVKFDASVELHVNLNVDPRHADQNIRDNLVLPAGTGRTVRVAVFADDTVEGADISGVEAILKALDKGTIDFDILIATPANMAKLGKFARVLGPRGLMPNPKSGTVTTDVAKAVKEAKAGRVEYRVDSTGIVHVGIGKVSFGAAKLEENARALLTSIKSNKPASVKGTYVKAIYVATTMGPSITVAVNEL
jgi:large subunit ribosomal protein L1